MAGLIELDGLGREFRRRRGIRLAAVDGVTLSVAPGEAVGLLGPNGAGKSTTIKMLTGILVPTAGRLRVCGLDPVRHRRELARRIGVVFGQRSQLWWDLPLAESFALLRTIHRVAAATHARRLAECVELLELAPFLTTPVRQLSLGQRMRGEVTAALLHSPQLLVLDEPTVGLDLISKERLRAFLARANAVEGVTLLLTTHDLNAAASHLPWVICLNHTITAQGTPEQVFVPEILNATYHGDMVVVRHDGLIFVQERPYWHDAQEQRFGVSVQEPDYTLSR